MNDLLITNATLPDGRTGIDVLASNGSIVDVAPHVVADAQAHGLGSGAGRSAAGVEGGVDDALPPGVGHPFGPRLPALAAPAAVGAVRRPAGRAPPVAEVLHQLDRDLVEEP